MIEIEIGLIRSTPILQYSITPVLQYSIFERVWRRIPMVKKTESNVRKKKAGKEPLPKDISPGTEMRKFTWEFLRHLFYTQGRALEMATPNDLYMALAYTVRNQLLERWLHTVQNYSKPGVRIVSYLSAEFLLGPHLENNLINLGIYDEARDALKGSWLRSQKNDRSGRRTGAGKRRSGQAGSLLSG